MLLVHMHTCTDSMPVAHPFAPGALHLAAARQCRAARRSSPRHDANPAPAHALRTRALTVQLPSMPWPAKSATRAAACLLRPTPEFADGAEQLTVLCGVKIYRRSWRARELEQAVLLARAMQKQCGMQV